MAVVVDPVLLDSHDPGHEGRGGRHAVSFRPYGWTGTRRLGRLRGPACIAIEAGAGHRRRKSMALSDLKPVERNEDRRRGRARRAEAAARRAVLDQPVIVRAACAHHHLHPHAAAGRRCISRNRRGGAGHRAGLRHVSRSGHRVRRRHLARRPRQRAGRRRRGRHVADEKGACRQRRRSGLHRRSRADPRGAQPRICATPACSFRSIPGANATLGGMAATRASGHQCGSLRNDEATTCCR